jgi:cystathionine beta-lyase/cystathionine gamma-synthase
VDPVMQENVRVLYMETASNPNSRVPDFDDLIRRTREVNPQCLVVVDNTFLSPIHFRPLDHGAGTPPPAIARLCT